MAEGGTLLRCYVEQSASRVQIPITPFFKGFRAFYFFRWRCILTFTVCILTFTLINYPSLIIICQFDNFGQCTLKKVGNFFCKVGKYCKLTNGLLAKDKVGNSNRISRKFHLYMFEFFQKLKMWNFYASNTINSLSIKIVKTK